MRLDHAVDAFQRQLEADGRSAATRAQYARQLGLLQQVLGAERELASLDAEDVVRVLTDPRVQLRHDGARKRPTSVNVFRSSLRAFFAYATRAGLCAQDPARLVRRARCAPGPPRTLAPELVAKLLAKVAAAIGPIARRDHAILHLLAASGIRVGSLVALDVADFDAASASLCLRHAKGSSPQSLPISRELCAHLVEFTRGLEHGPLFADASGRRLSVRQVQRRLNYWLWRAGIASNASPHMLRHTYAQRLYELTGDLLLVQSALGHRSIASTTVYARSDQRRLRAAIDALNGSVEKGANFGTDAGQCSKPRAPHP